VEPLHGGIREVEGGHGLDQRILDQQILDALVQCLSRSSIVAVAAVAHRYQEIMVEFEGLLDKRAAEIRTRPRSAWRSASRLESCAAAAKCILE
jgi:hypothetical protein